MTRAVVAAAMTAYFHNTGIRNGDRGDSDATTRFQLWVGSTLVASGRHVAGKSQVFKFINTLQFNFGNFSNDGSQLTPGGNDDSLLHGLRVLQVVVTNGTNSSGNGTEGSGTGTNSTGSGTGTNSTGSGTGSGTGTNSTGSGTGSGTGTNSTGSGTGSGTGTNSTGGSDFVTVTQTSYFIVPGGAEGGVFLGNVTLTGLGRVVVVEEPLTLIVHGTSGNGTSSVSPQPSATPTVTVTPSPSREPSPSHHSLRHATYSRSKTHSRTHSKTKSHSKSRRPHHHH